MYIYFSHRIITALNAYLALYPLCTISGNSIGAYLTKKGFSIASKALGYISIIAGAMFWAMDGIDRGKGVHVNFILYVPTNITPV